MALSNVIRYVKALDTSSTVGAGKTGLVFGDITAKYSTEGGALTSLTAETITTLGTYQAPTSNAHIRFKELNNADPTKGIYEVHFHNDQVAAAGKNLWLHLSATGALFESYELPLYDVPGLVNTIYTYLTTNLGALGAALSDIPKTGFKLASDGLASISAWTVAITGNLSGSVDTVSGGVTVTTNNDKTGYALTSGERTAIAAAVEAGILNEADATALLAAIAAKVEEFLINEGDATATLAAIATAVTNALGTGSGLTALATAAELAKVPKSDGSVGWNATARAQIQQEAQDAIEANHLDHLLAADYDPANKPGVSTALLNELIANDGGVSQFSTNALENAPSSSGGGGGLTGANVVTITVNDGTTVLEGAKVRLKEGVLGTGVLATNVSGVVTFSVDNATWQVSITKPGYTFTPTTLVVDGTETVTYSMTPVSVAASNPGQVTGYLYCYDEDGVIETGVSVNIQQLSPGTGSGVAYDSAIRTEVSNVAGLVSFTGLFEGASYALWRGTNVKGKKQFRVDSTDTSPLSLDSILG